MRTAYDTLLGPVITERSMVDVPNKKYVFRVARDANKIEIRKAVEDIFGVRVMSVNTINMTGKEKRQGVHLGRRSAWKKAIVRLHPESKTIEFFEGMV